MKNNQSQNKKIDDLIIDDLDQPIIETKKETKSKTKKEKKQEEKTLSKLVELKAGLQKIKSEAAHLLNFLDDIETGDVIDITELAQEKLALIKPEVKTAKAGEKIIEGVFDGQNMVGPDGKVYSVPANYASKSKLVEGDILKLTILADGSFIFKQIGPVERDRVVGNLIYNEEKGQYYVTSGEQRWKVLTASVTYYKGQINDETVILVPKDCKSRWAAVENIIKKAN